MGQTNGPAAVGVGTQVEMTESKIDAANTIQLEEAALDKLLSGGASGGEMVDEDDLWSCLFRRNGQTVDPSRIPWTKTSVLQTSETSETSSFG